MTTSARSASSLSSARLSAATCAPVDVVLSRLSMQGCDYHEERDSNGKTYFKALCPAHTDNHPSLSVTEGEDGRVLVYCFAGCLFPAIVAALNLKESDLMPPRDNARDALTSGLTTGFGTGRGVRPSSAVSQGPSQGSRYPSRRPAPVPPSVDRGAKAARLPKGQVIARYDYTDENGVLLYQVERDCNKQFWQRQPVLSATGREQWQNSIRGVRRVPYRLPAVIAALSEGRQILIVEGEKDVDNLASQGFTATTSNGGSGSRNVWKELAPLFTGARLCILPDNDAAGEEYAAAVADYLMPVAGEVRLLRLPDLPPKGDVSDWLGSGGDPDLLERLTAEAPLFEPVAESPAESADKGPVSSGVVLSAAPVEIPWPEPMAEEAFHGLFGRVVRSIEPHTESDAHALLVQLLTGCGNLFGRSAYFRVEGDRHHTNLFTAIVGVSGKGRKGTAWGNIRSMLAEVDTEWSEDRVKSGLSSGEGLIHAVRDEDDGFGDGSADKRLLAIESELATVLRVMEREGNTISARLRDAWDTGKLATLTKKDPAKATGAHISIIGHITRDELLRYLRQTETANGFANRFLWVCARRSKLLPDGGNYLEAPERPALIEELKTVAAFARTVERVQRDEAARSLWHALYPRLSADVPGLYGSVTSRAEAQVTRLSLLYALADYSPIIREAHLMAAVAVWEYCQASARFIFGDALGDPEADLLLRLLREAGAEGLTRAALSNALGRNKRADEIQRALEVLESAGMARHVRDSNGERGRDPETWFAC